MKMDLQLLLQGPAVSNPRHRRSQSAGGGIWLDHRPVAAVKLDTVMQPLMKRHKSITKLTEVKDFTNPKTSKYCLMTQEQDSSGELETCLYKVIASIRVHLFVPRSQN
jgi:kinesin family protein 23